MSKSTVELKIVTDADEAIETLSRVTEELDRMKDAAINAAAALEVIGNRFNNHKEDDQ